MQIRISTGSCRVAIGLAITAIKDKVESDRAAFAEQSLKNLREGAEHNGLHVDANRLAEMKEMVDRDVEHAMRTHPGNEHLEVLKNYSDMLDYANEGEVVIEDQDFFLLKAHLPKQQGPDNLPPS